MREYTIGAGFARGLMELAVSKGASCALLAERSGIDPADLQNQDNRIRFANYIALMRAGKELCNDPALALHFGEAFDVAEMSIVGLLGGACHTMAEGIALMNRYAGLAIELDGAATTDRYQLKRSGGRVWMIDTRPNPNHFPEITESSFARMVCGARRYFRQSQFVKAVHVTHPEPEYRAEYDRIFQVPVIFESNKNALLIDGAFLTYKMPPSSRYASGILSAHAEELLKSLDSSKSIRGRVESLLIPVLHTGDGGIDMIARKLRLSRQTLFRRLKAEGVTFEKVLDELRHNMAVHYLSGKNASVNETAYLVGFSDPAAFSRAFKRWTGSSPRMMRFKD
ncbi:MAG: AraC family transcriptional regulator [Terriglobales bacterium]